MSFHRQIRSVLAIVGLIAIVIVAPASAQTARVQFINLSPYPETDLIDVYRDGDLWVKGLEGPGATPFQDWRTGQIEISISEAGRGQENAFFTELVTIEFGKKYIIAVAGDPLRRADQPPLELLVIDEAREVTFLEPFAVSATLSSVVDGPDLERYWRQRWSFFDFVTARNFGDFSAYFPTPSVAFDIDYRVADGGTGPSVFPMNLVDAELRRMYADGKGTIVSSTLFDNSVDGREGAAILQVDYGFLDPSFP